MSEQANILELFSSYQGEGPYAGVRQVFLRTGGCHLRCAYCDTPESWTRAKECSIEEKPNSQIFRTEPNPLSLEHVVELLEKRVHAWNPHSISITGGEPLLQAPFLTHLLPRIRNQKVLTYLDTSGTLSDRLETIVDFIDIVALDLKLPSCPGVTFDPEDVARCISVARRTEVFVKIVLLNDSKVEEVEEAARIIANVDPSIPLILQPVTEIHSSVVTPKGKEIAAFRAAAEQHGRDVTVLPQLHPIAGWK